MLLVDKTTLNHKKVLLMLYAKWIGYSTGTFGHGQKMDGVQKIRFPNPIFAHNAIYFWNEVKLSLLIGFKLFDL
jgi:hypothetical protein